MHADTVSTTTPAASVLMPGAPGSEDREALIASHLGLVHHVARQISRRLAVDVDFDELISAGTIGLMNAVDSFDADRGAAFSTFAAPRIRGAILDELRRQDHVPRSIRRKMKDLAAAREALTRDDGRPPTDQEMADYLEIDLDTFWRWQSEVECSFFLPLDQPVDEDNPRAGTASQTVAGATAEMIENEINLQEEVEVLREAIMGLKEQERIVLSLYYFEELKLHEIGAIIELTESRVSQIRSRAVAKLRARISNLREMAA
ncbi:MAG TPA: FliA/WhiG family RNA polymerase sigma factor [Longimicrobiaceae bacterium]